MFRGAFRKKLLQLAEQLAYDAAGLPMALPFGRPVLPPEAHHAQFLHDYYRRHFWRQPSSVLRGPLVLVLWPFALAFTIVQYTLRNGSGIRTRSGKGPLRQMLEQACQAWRNSIAPPWYYMFELYTGHRGKIAGEYLTAHETIAGAYDLLEPVGTADQMADKVWFAEHCLKLGIKVVPVLFYVSRGAVHFVVPPTDPAYDTDLFVKPRSGNGGHHAERWDRLGEGDYRNSKGLTLSRDALFAHLAAQSLREDFIIQPRLVNHPALDDIANGALSTLRVLTCKDETGKAIATNVAFRMAVGTNNVVDNFHQGGLAAPVDLSTGTIGPASDIGRYPDIGWREIHPVSGAHFAGRELPFWKEAIALACEAGDAFPWRTAIGWDVAMLRDGPMIIEGNGKPDLDIHQRCERRPLGRQRIAELLAFNVKAAIKDR
ncbi:MAG: hypothetical protein LCH46_08040 [Proteobacteria bacterium]|nr:hypothetical protein [Pseudomonadota bacterium]